MSVELKNAGVNVFGNATKKESLILTLPDIHQASRLGLTAPVPLRARRRAGAHTHACTPRHHRDLPTNAQHKRPPPAPSPAPTPTPSLAPQALGESTNAAAVAGMIGERIYVKWPYLQEAQVGGTGAVWYRGGTVQGRYSTGAVRYRGRRAIRPAVLK
jgi:hypothetical protein